MKGQDPSISSSSRRESSPAPEKIRSKSIGCMSGIFHLVYKYHNRRRLTFGKKHEKNRVSSPTTKSKQKPASSPSQPPPPPPLSSSSSSSTSTSLQHESKVFTRVSCDTVPRSPTLPAEIRRRSKSLNSPERSRAPPALVARLMGLGDTPPMTTSDLAVAEKRRRLLGALEKCDEDLKALKKIIDVVKSSVAGAGNGADDEEGRLEKGDEHPLLQQPSPVSVLDEFTPSSAFNGFSKRYTINARVPQQQKKKPGGEEVITNISFVDRIMTCENMVHGKSNGSVVSSHLWTSKAMIESVNEVCKDIDWGERREIGRIGLALQDYICRDLIEEIVKELGFDCFYKIAPLPFESCKRRLHF